MVTSVFNVSQSVAVNGIFNFFFSLIDIGHGCSAPTGLVCTSAAALCPSLFVLQVSDLQPSLPLAQVFLWPHPAAPPTPSPSLPPASPLPLRCGNTISLCCRTTTTDTSGTTRKHGVQSGSGFRGKSGSGAGGRRGARRSEGVRGRKRRAGQRAEEELIVLCDS